MYDFAGARWRPLEELGQGGQGVAYLAKHVATIELERFLTGLLTRQESSDVFGAMETRKKLKHLRSGADYQAVVRELSLDGLSLDEAAKARKRFAKESSILTRVKHPSLIRMIEANEAESWMVVEYHPGGPLSRHKDRFRGDLLGSVLALQPIVDALVRLQADEVMHRDIKPDNIFVASDGRLVLGDFGIVFDYSGSTRISSGLSKVGTRAFMPQWAQPARIDQYDPTFDPYSIGCVLWCMVSGRDELHLWYHQEPENNLEKICPDRPEMTLAADLLDTYVVEKKKDAEGNTAETLVMDLRKLVARLRAGGREVSPFRIGPCRMCGMFSDGVKHGYRNDGGRVLLKPSRVPNTPIKDWSLDRVETVAAWICRDCGHTEFFSSPPYPTPTQ